MRSVFIKLYLIALPLFLALDMLWLGIVAKGFYREHIGFLLAPSVNWTAATAFYLLFAAGLALFVVAPAVERGSRTHALVFGAFFGFTTYATYDLTNLATLKDWPLAVTIVDMAWGLALGSLVSLTTYAVYTGLFAERRT